MTQLFFNNARGVLAESISTGNTLIKVKDQENIPASLTTGDYFLLTLFRDTTRYGENLEVVKVTAVTAGVDGQLNLTVVRGYEYPAAIHTAGARLEARLTAQSLRDLLSEAKSFTQEELSSLVDAAPGTLDTLNELAAALGDDPNFATTVTDALATKLDSSAYTAADVLAKLLMVDGTGSGVDADKLDGKELATVETEYKAYADQAEADAKSHSVQRTNHTGTQPLSTISDAGTAAASDVTTSATDTTSGRLIKVGDFGVGGDNYGTDLGNNISSVAELGALIPNTYGYVGRVTTLGISGLPDTTYAVISWPRSGRGTVWLHTNINDEIYYTNQESGGWQPIKRLVHSRNILGTVSQSGGVLTGAVIERGSNANGKYVKFADGTLICYGLYIINDMNALGAGTFADPYRSANHDIVFPHVFARSNPSFTCAARCNTTSQVEKNVFVSHNTTLGDRVLEMMAFRVGNSTSTKDVVVHWSTVGEWY